MRDVTLARAPRTIALALLVLAGCATCAVAAGEAPAAARPDATDSQRQSDVRRAGAEVMPFSLDRTLHTFDKTAEGGVQRVHARDRDPDQIAMIRMHLHAIAEAFAKRDFDAPMHIHGAGMPGLAELKAAGPRELSVTYRDTADGAEVDYVAHSPAVLAAIHRWFDAQLADHGRDAATSGGTHRR